MSTLLRKNFAKGYLSTGISDSDSQLTLSSGHTLPTESGNMRLVIWDHITYPDPADDENLEVVIASYSAPNVYDITRAQESTAAKAHSGGDVVALHYTAGMSTADLFIVGNWDVDEGTIFDHRVLVARYQGNNAYKLVYEDQSGTPGQDILVEYSVNGSTNWHDTFTGGDIYMRQSTNGGYNWSDAMRIIGEQGIGGEYLEYIFKRATFSPTKPDQADGVGGAPPNDWYSGPPESSDPLWLCTAWKKADGSFIIGVSEWDTPVQIENVWNWSTNGTTEWSHSFGSSSDREITYDIKQFYCEGAGQEWQARLRTKWIQTSAAGLYGTIRPELWVGGVQKWVGDYQSSFSDWQIFNWGPIVLADEGINEGDIVDVKLRLKIDVAMSGQAIHCYCEGYTGDKVTTQSPYVE